jgi:hypothetical protein
MQVKRFNQKNTAKFIYKIRDQFPGYRIDLVCDNAPWHNGKSKNPPAGRCKQDILC